MTGHGKINYTWHKSSASGDECVEICITADHVLIRDTKSRQDAILTFTHHEWRAFLTGVHLGEFDIPTD